MTAYKSQTIEALLRPLVERRVRGFIPIKSATLDDPIPPSDAPLVEEVYDSRFEALRLPWLDLRGPAIDASLGAIVRAAAACGLDVVELYQWPGGAWGCSLRHYLSTLPSDPTRPHGSGDTPEKAAARALVAAVAHEKEQ